MTKGKFKTAIHYHAGVATLDLSGELTALAGIALEAAYRTVASRQPEIIWLNFSGVTYINSGGIALIINLLAQTYQTPQTLLAYGLSPFHVELFKLAGLTQYMPVCFARADHPCKIDECIVK